MKWSQKFGLWAAFCGCAIGLFGGGPAQEEPKESFVVGMASGYAPYVSLNEQGEYEGFDVDLARLIAERMHRKLVLQDLGGMTSLLVALQKSKIDAIVWAMSITEERQKEMDMVYYQGDMTTDISLLFWGEAPSGIEKIEDLAKLKGTICVEAGSYQDTVLRQYPSLKVRFLDKITDGLLDIKYKKSLALAIDSSLIGRLQAQYPELKVLRLPLPETQQSLGNGICINKEKRATTAEIEKIIAELRAEGKIAELEKKWNLAGAP